MTPLARLICIGALLAASAAHASSVTVVATGDTQLQAPLSRQVEGWLRAHGHTVDAPMSTDAQSTLLNCMQLDDQGCARGVVEAQAKGEAVLFASAIKSRSSDATVLQVYWFPKGKEPIGMRRACEECNVDLMKSTVEEMLGMVVGASKLERGRVELHSRPEGMTVLLDNENIGVTPLERELPAGEHRIVLMHRGQAVGERTLKIHSEVTAEITIPVTLPAEPAASSGRSSLAGGLVMGLGAAALATGIALYATSETDDGSKLYYRDTKNLGLGVAAGGAVITGLGVWLWLRARGGESTADGPTVSLSPHAGVVGWSRAF